MPQYLLSVWHDEPYDDVDLSAPETERQMAQTAELTVEMERAGASVFVAGLRPATSATVVRAAGGNISMTDGPYAETKEQMAGFWVIEAADLDAASTGPPRLRPPASGRSRSDLRMPDLGDIFRREAGLCTATLIRGRVRHRR